MERGPPHGGAGQRHRLEFRYGGDDSGATDLSYNSQQPAGSLFWGVLVGDRPTRRLGIEAGLVLQLQGVQLHHHPIGGIKEPMALLLPLRCKSLHRREICTKPGVGVYPEPCLLQPLQAAPLMGLGYGVIIRQVQRVAKKIEPAGSHDFGVELTQGTGAGIAGVGK